MPIEVARRAVEKYSDVRELIPSTMGEPLLYSYFNELLDICREFGIPMNLTTNGSFPGKWGSDEGMERLVAACSDIKVSSLAYEMGGLEKLAWHRNLEKLLGHRAASISLQVTLHRENFERAEQLLQWAEQVGINRIKWNPVIFLDCASQELRNRFALPDGVEERLRAVLHSESVCCEGSLFFEKEGGSCAVTGKDCTGYSSDCPFADEVWVWPDGHEDHCPNPVRRWSSSYYI